MPFSLATLLSFQSTFHTVWVWEVLVNYLMHEARLRGRIKSVTLMRLLGLCIKVYVNGRRIILHERET